LRQEGFSFYGSIKWRFENDYEFCEIICKERNNIILMCLVSHAVGIKIHANPSSFVVWEFLPVEIFSKRAFDFVLFSEELMEYAFISPLIG